ncbi:MAG: class I SAM-dependent methyltransferase [Anaerolineae bacterium]|nr:class I SAM-dependent methyltransferase [Gemmatimonadaceae bacterium]
MTSLTSSAVLNTERCAVCAGALETERILARLDRCRACGFISYQGADPEAIAALYDEGYFTGGEYPDYLGQQDSLRRSMRMHLRQIAHYMPLAGSLFEVGCAYGLFLDEARRHFDRVAGVDICAVPLEYARATLGLDAREDDFLAMNFPGERFDAICVWDTIEHIPSPDALLAKAASLLSSNGMLFLTTGDIGALNARVRGASWRQIHPPSHLNYFSRATISRLCERVGLQVVGIETAAYFHTIFNLLASIRLRGGASGGLAGTLLKLAGERRARSVGVWLNLGDIMFVAARKRAD